MKNLLMLGALFMALAVALGAFGAHGLKTRLSPDMLAVWKTAVDYHVYHALGLLAVGLLIGQLPAASGLALAGYVMVAGIVLFSGSLYALALTGIKTLGMITPLGGLAWIVSWLLVLVAVIRA